MKLTKRSIEKLPTPTGQRAYYRDDSTRGLGLVVNLNGSRDFFWYRKVRGRPRWKTLGEFPELGLEAARQRADEKNSLAANWKSGGYRGPDPFEEIQDITFGAVFDDYVAKRLPAHAKNPVKAIQSAKWIFNGYLSAWKNRRLSDIRRSDVRALHAHIGETNGHVTANRVAEIIRVLFNWAMKADLFSGENPTRAVTMFPEQSRTRFLQPAELPQFFKVLSEEANVDLKHFVVVALFCGARKSDILSMRWADLDLDGGVWHIPDPKNQQPYAVTLMPELVTLLKSRSRKSEWVFPSTGATGHLTDLKRSWGQFLKRAGLKDFRIHDCRRSHGSYMAAAGVSLPIIGKSLGHKSGEATAIYARLNLESVRQAVRNATSTMLIGGKTSAEKLLAPHE